MALTTTTIGSYPKPEYVPIPNWFEIRKSCGDRRWDPTRAYEQFLANPSDDADELIDRGTQEVVLEQTQAGIDVPTDGEIRREHYIYYHLRHLSGFDFLNLTEKSMRDGSWLAEVPTVRGPVAAGAPFLANDWRIAQAATERPVKITVPGPLTIMDSTIDVYYGDPTRLGAALADALNTEICRLASAGCTWIQIDEPVFARYPETAMELGFELLNRCFHGVPESTRRAVHICCGYPADLDVEEYPKADTSAYSKLASDLDALSIDAISIEDAHRHNDIILLEHFTRLAVILGVVGIARTRIESVEEIRNRLLCALDHIDSNRLIAAPDCGMTMLPRSIAQSKLRNLSEAAHSIG